MAKQNMTNMLLRSPNTDDALLGTESMVFKLKVIKVYKLNNPIWKKNVKNSIVCGMHKN